MKELFDTMPQIGTVEWIGLRPEKKEELIEVENVNVNLDNGLEGDHYKGTNGKRQVTLIQKEHLDAVASILKKERIKPLTNQAQYRNQRYQSTSIKRTAICNRK